MTVKNVIAELAEELVAEHQQAMSPQERRLHEIAQQLLLLERDLRAPGATRSSGDRTDRILEAIAKENF